MRWMTELYPSLGFDCASEREISEACGITNKIIYAQPCKKPEDIKIAQAKGVTRTVVDSEEEIRKLAEAEWKGDVLIRLLVSDGGSKQPFGIKFGAPSAWLPKMYEVAKFHNVNLTGFSFHVGSECQNPIQFKEAIYDCKMAEKEATRHGFCTKTIDIGGGFLADKKSFIHVAEHVQKAQELYFPDPSMEWIAEPGRFLAAPTHTLYTTVIGKKPTWPLPETFNLPKWRITIDESVYGCFSNIPFDHQTPVMERVQDIKDRKDKKTINKERKRPTIVFGRTCDSGDCIGKDIPLVDVEVGDVLKIPNMGAYTTVTSSEFNGFPKPGKIYEA